MRRTLGAAVVAAFLGFAGSAAAGPGMAWGQWTSPDLTFGECMARTPKALKAEGFTTIEHHGRFWFGSSTGPVSLVVSCYGLARGTIVTINGSNEGSPAPALAKVRNVANRIFTDEKPSPAPGSPPVPTSPPAPPGPPVAGSGWTTRPDQYRGQNGKRFVWSCPAGGTAAKIWGTDIYTDDSPTCVAAVHAGLITFARGGSVTIEIRPGESSYVGSTRNGVTSSDYGSWSGSYVFVVDGKPREPAPKPTGGSGWSSNPSQYRGQNGARFTWGCPAGGTLGSLWGTDVYTDDSSVCTAAVHAGLINTTNGGTVTIEIRPGQSSYQGSTRNGVTSAGYGSWSGSFVFVG